jgi:hypothetical protein
MDRHVVVVPANGRQVVGIVIPALAVFSDVMGLKPVSAAAAGDRASAVAPQNETPDGRGNGAGGG